LDLTVASGQEVLFSLVFELLDNFGDVMVTDNESSAQITATDGINTTVSGTRQVTAKNGLFTFDHFSVTSNPNSTISISISTDAIDLNALGQAGIANA
jgi:hypothetical protein